MQNLAAFAPKEVMPQNFLEEDNVVSLLCWLLQVQYLLQVPLPCQWAL